MTKKVTEQLKSKSRNKNDFSLNLSDIKNDDISGNWKNMLKKKLMRGCLKKVDLMGCFERGLEVGK